MFLKRFRIQVILRILLLAASCLALFYLILHTKVFTATAVVGCLVLYQVYALVRYVEKTNQNLNRFLLAVKYGDFSQSFPGKELGPPFAELGDTFNDIIEKVQQTRSEKEAQYRYLQTIVQHVGIGLITFQADGKVVLMNNAAKRLLKIVHLKNINDLAALYPVLAEKLLPMRAGEKALVKIDPNEMELVIHAAEFVMQEQKFTLVSLQNIQSELEEKEMEAWQTLIRVLTHEIMNSMTPITSMAATVLDLLNSSPNPDGEKEQLADMKNALKTIHKRSQGLTDFVSAYRNLTLIPRPNFKVLSIEELFNRVGNLMENKLKEMDIPLHWGVEPRSLELFADPGLIEQVLINLVLNAVEALGKRTEGERNEEGEGPLIQMKALLEDSGRIIIQVKDNGPGIVPEALNRVFIPFFTTKNKGSGIGLSLSRQIMKLHKGNITVHSTPHKETTFTLKF